MQAGANTDVSDFGGVNPLYAAAAYNQLDCMKLVLAKGADANHHESNGAT